MQFQWSCFKSWKVMLWKCCPQYASKFEKLSSGHRTGKGQFSFQFQRKAMPKNAQTTAQLHSSHMVAKSCSKFSKPGFNNTSTVNFQMFKLVLERQRNQRSNCQHPLDHRKSKRGPKNPIYFCFIDYAKAFDWWITINCGKLWNRCEYQTTWPVSWETCMQVRKQQLELDMEQQTGSK